MNTMQCISLHGIAKDEVYGRAAAATRGGDAGGTSLPWFMSSSSLFFSAAARAAGGFAPLVELDEVIDTSLITERNLYLGKNPVSISRAWLPPWRFILPL